MKKFSTVMLVLLAGIGILSGQSDSVFDGGFEDGTPNPSWNEASLVFGTPLCDLATCGNCAGNCSARTGSWYAWFGGANELEIGSIDQDITIPAGATNASLTFWVKMATTFDHGLDSLKCQMDTSTMFVVTNADSNTYSADYVMETMDVSAYADGSSHNLQFWGYQQGAGITNILVDDVSLTYIDPASGVTHDLLFEGIKIYPNPTHDQLSIDVSFAKTNDMEMRLFTTSGELVSAHMVPAGKTGTLHISVAGLASGVYLLKINDGLGVVTKPVIISR